MTTEGERLAVLEMRFQHLEEKIDRLERALDRGAVQMVELNRLLDQARGARWIIGGLVALGGIAATVAAKFGFSGVIR